MNAEQEALPNDIQQRCDNITTRLLRFHTDAELNLAVHTLANDCKHLGLDNELLKAIPFPARQLFQMILKTKPFHPDLIQSCRCVFCWIQSRAKN